MPNWASGTVSVRGAKQNIIDFTNRFVYENEVGGKTPKTNKFFSRSFAQISRGEVVSEIEELFTGQPDDAEQTYDISVDFAWSASGCLDVEYPTDDSHECINLVDACKQDNVSVRVETEECGMCFEESIECDSTGELSADCWDMPQYECPACGTVSAYSSVMETDECACYECGNYGLTPVKIDDADVEHSA